MPEMVTYPSITFCFQIENILNWESLNENELKLILKKNNIFNLTTEPILDIKNMTKIKETMNSYNEPESKAVFFNILSNFKVPRILSMTKQDLFKDIIEYVFLYHPDIEINDNERYPKVVLKSSKELEEKMHVDQFILGRRKCFTLQVKQQETFRFTSLEKVTQGFSYILGVEFLKSCPRSFQTYINPPGQPLTQRTQNIFYEGATTKYITNDIMQSSLLGYPFKTQCVDYKKRINKMSQEECTHDCERDRILLKFNSVAKNLRGYMSDSNASYDLRYNLILYKNISYLCRQRCRFDDCFHVNYSPRLISQNHGKSSDIYVTVSKTPVINTLTLPNIPIIAFITNILSTFGIWLGISLLGCQHFIHYMINKFKLSENESKRVRQFRQINKNRIRFIREQLHEK